MKRHILGQSQDDDVVIYEEADDTFFLGLSQSRSEKFIFISSSNYTSSEVWFFEADATTPAPQLIEPRTPKLEYSVEHHGDHFLVLTNADEAVDFKLMRARITAPARKNWTEFVPHRLGTYLIDVIAYKDYLVRLERRDALPKIVIMHGDDHHEVAFDPAAYSIGLKPGYEYDSDELRFSFETPAQPSQIFAYDMQRRARELLKTQSVPSGHDPDHYVVERVSAPSAGGAEVPVTILRLKSTPVDGTAPVLLYGYGSYGVTIPASFSTNILPMVDRGVIYALAHPRGGAARGREWYLKGKLEHKQNTFTDFAAVADMLIANDYTKAGQIVIYGGSAGGLLVGATVNQRPELFGGVIAAVPFVDVLSTISDDTLPLTPPEWDEWGNPITDNGRL